MPPKWYSKAKRNYSYQNQNKKDTRIDITFLLIGPSKVGIDIPYKIITSDKDIKNLIKQHGGTWQHNDRMWTMSYKNYLNILDKVLQHCKHKQYFCHKIPHFVHDAQMQMPLQLIVRVSKRQQKPIIRYMSQYTNLDPQTLPFYGKLYGFQKQSLKFGIQHHGRLLLADQMGVGKTIQSLAIAYMYRFQWPMLIICPSTLRFNWLNQISNWYGQYIKKSQIQVYLKGGSPIKDSIKILIISYDLAWKYKQIWQDYKLAIVDQAHYLKNSGCKRSDILVPQLAKKRRIILLTGTPAFARPRQIFNLASIVRPDAFYSFTQFGNRYCQPTRNPWSGSIQYNGCKHSKELYYLLKDRIMLRRLKKDVLTELPDKQRQKITIQTDKSITRQINMLIQQNGSGGIGMKPQDMIMQMFGLKHAGQTRSDDYHKKRQSIMQAYRLSGTAKIKGVKQYILQLLSNDVKILIFAHHRIILDQIQKQLKNNKYQTIRIDGQVQMTDRQKRVDQFQNNKNIMAALLSISAAGVGLTLTASSTVVFAQLHWTPAMLIQAQDRAHRIGQKNSVNCHYLIGQGTLDNILYNYLLKKINTVSTFVDGAQQRLEMEEMNKGEIGKVSKSVLVSGNKKQNNRQQQQNKNNSQQKQKQKQRRISLSNIKPIYRPKNIQIININGQNNNNNNGDNSQDTDISSDISNNINVLVNWYINDDGNTNNNNNNNRQNNNNYNYWNGRISINNNGGNNNNNGNNDISNTVRISQGTQDSNNNNNRDSLNSNNNNINNNEYNININNNNMQQYSNNKNNITSDISNIDNTDDKHKHINNNKDIDIDDNNIDDKHIDDDDNQTASINIYQSNNKLTQQLLDAWDQLDQLQANKNNKNSKNTKNTKRNSKKHTKKDTKNSKTINNTNMNNMNNNKNKNSKSNKNNNIGYTNTIPSNIKQQRRQSDSGDSLRTSDILKYFEQTKQLINSRIKTSNNNNNHNNNNNNYNNYNNNQDTNINANTNTISLNNNSNKGNKDYTDYSEYLYYKKVSIQKTYIHKKILNLQDNSHDADHDSDIQASPSQ